MSLARTFAASIVAMFLVFSSATAASAKPESPTPARVGESAGLGSSLKVQPGYTDGLSMLSVDTLEWSDSLPDYVMQVRAVSSGALIPLDYGYASRSSSSDLESDWTTQTTQPLQSGALYEVYFKVSTSGFWHCSVRDPNGCSWWEGTTTQSKWRFIYSPETTLSGTPFRDEIGISISAKKKNGKHGWRVSGAVTRNKLTFPNRLVLCEYQDRGRGRWTSDGVVRADANGKFNVKFRPTSRLFAYRFVIRSDSITRGAQSNVLRVTPRR